MKKDANPLAPKASKLSSKGRNRKRKNSLQDSEGIYKKLADSSLQGIVIAQGFPPRLIYANPAISRMLGYSYDELTSLTPEGIESFIHPEDRSGFFGRYRERLEGKKAAPGYEFRGIRKDGSIAWFQASSTLIETHGKPAVLATFIDITERKRAEETIEKQRGFEKIIMTLSANLMNIPSSQMDEEIRRALQKIGEFAQVDRSYVFLFDDSGERMSNTHEWCAPGIEPQIHRLQNIRLDSVLPFFARIIRSRQVFYVPRVADLTEEAEVEKREFEYEKIQSLVCVPIICRDKLVGFLGFDSVKEEKDWPMDLITLLKIVGEMIANAIVRKREEEALRASEERYKTILENIEDGYFEVNLAGDLTFFNDSLCRILGYSRDEMMGMGNRKYTDEENRKKLYEAFNKVYRTGNPTKAFAWEIFRKDGTKRIGEVSISLIKDSGGIPIGFRGIARDVTERVKIEEALAQSEERYRTLVEESFDGIWIQKGFRIIFANRRLHEMLGYEEGELEGLDHWLVYHPDYQVLTRERAKARLRGEAVPSTYEVKFLRKDGTSFWGEIRAKIVNLSGEAGIQIWARDISERKQAEETIQAEKERFQSLSESAPFGMAIIGQDGTFQYINPKFKELFGYGLADIQNGKTWFKKAYPDPAYRHQVIATWLEDLRSLKTGERVPRIFKARCKDGSEKIINFISVQLESGENLLTCEDITDLKNAEEALRQTEEQLRHSQKMEAIGKLAGGIAHDFNNLLTVIKGYAELSCLGLNPDHPLRENLEEIRKASERASNLTRQLLAFGRRQILDFKVINLNALLKDLNKMLHRILGEDIELAYHLAQPVGKVRTDPGQIEQVILNLAVNARDAMPSGGKLTIETSNVYLSEAYARTHLEVTPGHYVMLSVSDNGPGMTPEVRERIFEPFFTTKEKGKGTGLGLSTVYGIVKQSGGHINVYSEPGTGTTFKIYLPRVEEEEDHLQRKTVDIPLPMGNETILLAEDEQSVRELGARILRDRGYQVYEARNGQEALAIVERYPEVTFHLLLTDVVMPGMSGKELADRLMLSIPHLKALFISGYTDNAIVHHGVLMEGIDFLQKPFTYEGLARKVREVLDR